MSRFKTPLTVGALAATAFVAAQALGVLAGAAVLLLGTGALAAIPRPRRVRVRAR